MAAAGRREAILAESARLFADRGIAATTIREIADAVGLNSGTLYHYFDSKDAIVSDVLTSFLADLVERYDAVVATDASARERLGLMVRASFEAAELHPFATEIYQNESADLTALPRIREIEAAVESSHAAWLGIVEDGVRDGEFHSGVDSFEFQRMMRECVFMAVRWHRTTLRKDIDSLTDTITTVFLDGFAAAPTAESPSRTPRPAATRRARAGRKPTAQSAAGPGAPDDLRAELDALRVELRAIREALAVRPSAG